MVGSAANIPADQICVRGFELRRVFRVPGAGQAPKARSESLHLCFDGFGLVDRYAFGTWQYAQAVCRPAGARVGSKRLC